MAEIEPLGIVPDHRRRGLAGALCHGAAERVAARGGRQVYINGAPGTDYPAPAAAYLAAGFRTVRQGTSYRLGRPRTIARAECGGCFRRILLERSAVPAGQTRPA